MACSGPAVGTVWHGEALGHFQVRPHKWAVQNRAAVQTGTCSCQHQTFGRSTCSSLYCHKDHHQNPRRICVMCLWNTGQLFSAGKSSRKAKIDPATVKQMRSSSKKVRFARSKVTYFLNLCTDLQHIDFFLSCCHDMFLAISLAG